jgi:hypothetical protein
MFVRDENIKLVELINTVRYVMHVLSINFLNNKTTVRWLECGILVVTSRMFHDTKMKQKNFLSLL